MMCEWGGGFAWYVLHVQIDSAAALTSSTMFSMVLPLQGLYSVYSHISGAWCPSVVGIIWLGRSRATESVELPQHILWMWSPTSCALSS